MDSEFIENFVLVNNTYYKELGMYNTTVMFDGGTHANYLAGGGLIASFGFRPLVFTRRTFKNYYKGGTG